MSGRTHGGKGDRPRPVRISLEEKDLRYELPWADPKRKRAIMRKLKQIEKAKEDESNK